MARVIWIRSDISRSNRVPTYSTPPKDNPPTTGIVTKLIYLEELEQYGTGQEEGCPLLGTFTDKQLLD